jgi:hypothetical protein
LKSVQQCQRRRVKCEKLMDGRRTLTHDKSSHGLWPCELKQELSTCTCILNYSIILKFIFSWLFSHSGIKLEHAK